eukprot:jgi/Mesen1/7804/ME000408S06915
MSGLELVCDDDFFVTRPKQIWADLESSKPSIQLLYVTPEAIDKSELMGKLRKLHERGLLTLVAIDEAHCISSWGHDFRPSYRRLSTLRASLPGVPLLALTATAAHKVRADIVQSLHLRDPTILVSSFNRPNIFYEGQAKQGGPCQAPHGIDRASVRLVCHVDVPKSIESFYQESGRAGRDGKPARSILYYSSQDRSTMMVKYCSDLGCRRRKLLSHFGEEVSPMLCKGTCDACRSPSKVAANLEALKVAAAGRGFGRGGSGAAFISRATGAKNMEAKDSEFWRYDEGDHAQKSGDSISSSGGGEDEDAEEEVSRAARRAGSQAKLGQKMDALLRAEEAYNARHRPASTSKLPARASGGSGGGWTTASKLAAAPSAPLVRPGVSDAHRASSLVRLQQAVEQLEPESAARLLEEESFRKFGKTSKSFYTSQMAKHVRWLASASYDDVASKVAHANTGTAGSSFVAAGSRDAPAASGDSRGGPCSSQQGAKPFAPPLAQGYLQSSRQGGPRAAPSAAPSESLSLPADGVNNKRKSPGELLKVPALGQLLQSTRRRPPVASQSQGSIRDHFSTVNVDKRQRS